MEASNFDSSQLAVYGDKIIIDFGTYSKPQIVLDKLSIAIPNGCIYGLIGPSGCGKTTLQRAITGLLKPSSGLLKVYEHTPGSKESLIPGPLVGYMPQEIALDDELTVKEQLIVLGQLAGVPSEKVKERGKEIMSIMDIDELDKRTSDFSLGQRRRISLACTLIHSPKLLLLDEPTVGSDIVLVQKIWKYLRKLNENKDITIVISTHYLEEVTKADYFGFLINGQLRFHGEPHSFIKSAGAITFEEAILAKYTSENKIDNEYTKGKHVDNQIDDIKHLNVRETLTIETRSTSPEKTKLNFFNTLYVLIWRYCLLWKVNMLPLYIGILFCQLFIGFFIPNFYGRAMSGVTVAYTNLSNRSIYEPILTNYSTANGLKLIQVADESMARIMVEENQAQSYFLIPEEFDAGIETRVASALSSVSDESLQLAGQITMYEDNAHPVLSDAVRKVMYEALNEIMESIMVAKGLATNKLDFVRIEGVIENTDDPKRLMSRPLNLIRVYVLMLEVYVLMLFSFWTTKEYHNPIDERLKSLAVKKSHLIISSIILALPILLIGYIALFYIFIIYLNIPFKGYMLLTLPITAGVILCGISKAMILGLLIPSKVLALILVIFYSGMNFSYGGVIFPYEAMEYFIQPLTYLFPGHFPSEALKRIIMYGDNVHHPTVIFGYVYTIIVAMIHVVVVLLIN